MLTALLCVLCLLLGFRCGLVVGARVTVHALGGAVAKAAPQTPWRDVLHALQTTRPSARWLF